MTKRLRCAAWLLSLCLLCGALSGCSLFDLTQTAGSSEAEDQGVYESVGRLNITYSDYYTPIESRYSYGCLSARQQELYDRILDQVYGVSAEYSAELAVYPMKTVRVPGQLTENEIRLTFRAISNDNPCLFWLSQTFSHKVDPGWNRTEVVAYSEFSPSVLPQMMRRVEAAADAFYAAVPAGLSAYEREKLVHDYVIDHCVYDREMAATTEVSERNVRAHSIYGALADGLCVCEGYGMAMQLLLNGLGIECVTLTGMSNDSAVTLNQKVVLHLWNAVLLDGEWYHVDSTWDDQEQAIRRYSYFNLSDDAIARDHVLSPTPDGMDDDAIADHGTEDLNLFIPVCSGTAYHYFAYECPHLTDYSGGEVKNALFRAAQNRASSFTFYIDPERLDYDEAVRLLFRDTPQYFFGYLDDVNSRLYDYEIDDSNLTYYVQEESSAVCVDLRYF